MNLMKVAAPAAALLLAGGLYSLRAGDGVPDAAMPAAVTRQPAVELAPAPARTEVAADASAVAETDTPPDVPAGEWRQLKAVMGATPEGRQELVRVGEFLTFRHRMAKWQQAKAAGGDAAAREELAQFLLDDMATHVARRELTAGEAQALTTALLQDRISDPVALRQAVTAQLEKVRAAQPPVDAQAQARQQAALAAYRQEEAAIVAQWRSRPEPQRDAQWLENQLEAARQRTLGALAP